MRSKYLLLPLILLWTLALLCLVPVAILFQEVFGYPYLQLDSLSVVGFFALVSLLCLFAIWNYYRKVIIENGCVTLSKGFGIFRTSFYLSEIRNYSLQHFKNRTNEYYELSLLLNSGKQVRVTSTTYHNFDEWLPILIEGRLAITPSYKRPGRTKGWAILILIYAMMAGGIAFICMNYLPAEKTYLIKPITVTLLENPEIYGKGRGKNISFATREYQDHYFISNIGYGEEVAVDDLEKNVKAGDTITLFISVRDYDLKIIRSRKPDFYDKHFEWPEIKVYGIQDDQWIYSEAPKEVFQYAPVDVLIMISAFELAILIFIVMISVYPEMIY